MNIILCGLPGSGKTTIGEALAKQLRCLFIDTDHELLKQYPEFRSCRELTQNIGEKPFRLLEHETIKRLAPNERFILSTGGGTLTYLDNISLLQSRGLLIYLQASPELILDRVLRNGTPTYLDPHDPLNSFFHLAQKRINKYEESCQLTINTDHLSPNEILNLLIKELSNV